jgi:hypothetical protein
MDDPKAESHIALMWTNKRVKDQACFVKEVAKIVEVVVIN